MARLLTKLPREFYDRDCVEVARALLGKVLIHQTDEGPRMGQIVETEAYLGPHDLAAHSARGRTARTEVMFGPPGYAYVYLIYGIHHCFNVVTQAEGMASAVLIRALAPLPGDLPARMSGPGLLCRALQIDRSLNGCDLLGEALWLAYPNAAQTTADVDDADIVERPRVGVDYAGEWAKCLLRFYIRGNTYISKP